MHVDKVKENNKIPQNRLHHKQDPAGCIPQR